MCQWHLAKQAVSTTHSSRKISSTTNRRAQPELPPFFLGFVHCYLHIDDNPQSCLSCSTHYVFVFAGFSAAPATRLSASAPNLRASTASVPTQRARHRQPIRSANWTASPLEHTCRCTILTNKCRNRSRRNTTTGAGHTFGRRRPHRECNFGAALPAPSSNALMSG